MEILRQRKRKILATYETDRVQEESRKRFHDFASQMTADRPSSPNAFSEAVREEQLRDLEQLWYAPATNRAASPASCCT